ncbi:Zn-ribbon domain-containing protein [Halovivax gelatinilyticus]|uniref:Zn-ribbon domain-containing protein n=1 Tax=Halovivax gelatinilyticus TaxID=2961597 RepID=UPI0020CA9345|nr:Zn-ribbon domain-containing protein [Halovivax gelatinilyticus]
MPHQCTNCDRRFPDGSKEMLSGCPDCGGNKFQFAPVRESSSAEPSTDANENNAPPESTSTESTDTTPRREWPETARRPAEKDPDFKRERRTDDALEDDFEWVEGDEDTAQASARSDVVAPDELPSHTASTEPETNPPESVDESDGRARADDVDDRPDNGRVVSEPEADQPSLEQLREELNEQFESIKIVNPGQYELNLMELYDREEHIVSLQEDGRYVINVPDSWHSDE